MRLRFVVIGLGLIGIAAALATVRLWPVRDIWVERPVRATTNWQQLALARLAVNGVEQSSIDRIAIHAIAPEILKIDPAEPGTIGLGSWSALDAGARAEKRRSMGRLYRSQTQQPVFPTDPASTPEHAITGTRTLAGDDAREWLRLWRAQTLDCTEREGFTLCHSPNFAITFYRGERLLFEVELCWSCQEASFSAGDKTRLRCDFAVSTPAAHSLRRALKGLFPNFRTEEDVAPAFFPTWQ